MVRALMVSVVSERLAAKKIRQIEELTEILAGLRTQGKKIVQCHGAFDLLHPGHVRHLQVAKEEGDILVVTLTRDAYIRKGPGRPVFNEILRAEMIAALEIVDYVCLIDDSTAVNCILQLKPHLYAKGPDYRDPAQDLTGKILDEERAVRSIGGEMFFTSDDVVFSSSHLINRFTGVMSETQRAYLRDVKAQFGSEAPILDALRRLERLNVLLIGDTIIDEYVYCEPLGQSLKHPLVVHKHLKEERFCGGVVAVANQLAEWCAQVHVVSVVGGQDGYADYVQRHLRPNVEARFFVEERIPTVVKRRYLYHNVEQKVFEICHIDDEHTMNPQLESSVCAHLADVAASYDLVMISDYGHGMITSRLIDLVQSSTRFLAVNAQTNSANLGYNFITKKYAGFDFGCIDEGEARLASHDRHTPIEQLGETLRQQLKATRLIITRGRHGSFGFDAVGARCAAPALAIQVIDRVGAGDAVFAVTAPCSALELPLELASFVGNAVGALAVQIVGNRRPVNKTDLVKFVTTLLK